MEACEACLGIADAIGHGATVEQGCELALREAFDAWIAFAKDRKKNRRPTLCGQHFGAIQGLLQAKTRM